VLPITVFVLSFVVRDRQMSVACGGLLASALVEFGYQIHLIPNYMLYASLILMFLTCLWMLWLSFGIEIQGKYLKYVGVLPLIAGIACLAFFPVTGFFDVLTAIFAAIVALSAAFLYFSGKGGVLAFSAFLLMVFPVAGQGSPWLSWLSPVIMVAGYFLIGYHLSLRRHEGVDRL
jgi:hypothetical protein